MEHCLQENGIAFLFAPKMHPAMRFAAPVRKALGFRTIFNLLGPLVNPAGAKGQVVGVFDASMTEFVAECLKRLGVRRAFVVHGGEGMDEFSVCSQSKVSELKNGAVKTYEFNPRKYIPSTGGFSELKGGDADFNAVCFSISCAENSVPPHATSAFSTPPRPLLSAEYATISATP